MMSVSDPSFLVHTGSQNRLVERICCALVRSFNKGNETFLPTPFIGFPNEVKNNANVEVRLI